MGKFFSSDGQTKAAGKGKFPFLIKALTLILVSGSILALLIPGKVLAHAGFLRSDPAPFSVLAQSPARVSAWFTEPAEPEFSAIRVLGADGRIVDNADSAVDPQDPTRLSVSLPKLPDGTYTATWINVSVTDGHGLAGSFIFTVGTAVPGAQSQTPPASPNPFTSSLPDVVLRWLELFSILTVLGCLIFQLVIASAATAVAEHSEELVKIARRLNSRSLKLVWICVGIFLLASLAEILQKTASANGIPVYQALGSVWAYMTHTGWGEMWEWRMRLVLLVVIALAMVPGKSHELKPGSIYGWLFQLMALSVTAGILFTIASVSHGASAGDLKYAAVFSDYLHLLAAGFWVGGLAYLVLVVPPVMKPLIKEYGKPSAANVICPESHTWTISRFSALAVLSVGILVITGLYNSWAQVTILPALTTPYGWTLLVKLGLIVPLIIVAAVNLLWVKPRLDRDGRALHWLHLTVVGEVILAVLVLASVGMLTNLEPARQAAYKPVAENRILLHEETPNVHVSLEITPGIVGQNRLEVGLQDTQGTPITNATNVSLHLKFLNANLGDENLVAVPEGKGLYLINAHLLSVAGPWSAQLLVTRPDAFDENVNFNFNINATPGIVNAPVSLDPATGRRLWGWELLLLGLLFGGVAVPFGSWKTKSGVILLALGVMGLAAGILVMVF